MRRFLIVVMLPMVLIGCRSETSSGSDDTATLASESVESYELRGVVEGKDPSANALTVRHEEIPGLMRGMTMSFRVEGAEVASLPAIGEGLEATLNVAGPDYWLTDVRAAEVPASLIEDPAAATTESATAGATESPSATATTP